MLLVGVPLGNLAFQAGKLVVQTDEGRIRSWSLARGMLTIAASLWDARRELGWSLLIGSFSATSATALAAVMAWLARRGGWSTAAVFGSTGMMLAVPGPLLGLAVLWLRDLPLLRWMLDSWIFAPWLALTIRGLPPAILILWHAFRTIPGAMLDSAEINGAGPLTRFWRIALPSRVPALILAWLVSFTVSLGDLAASILVVPPGVEPLSVHIFSLIITVWRTECRGFAWDWWPVSRSLPAAFFGSYTLESRL